MLRYLLLFFFPLSVFSQISNDTLYLKHDDKMRIVDEKTIPNEIRVNLSFAIGSKGNSKITTFIFFIDNIKEDFKELKFNEINDTIPLNILKNKYVLDLNSLKDLDACEQYFLLADTKTIFLIKKLNNHFLKYKLTYLSTQRGWEYTITE